MGSGFYPSKQPNCLCDRPDVCGNVFSGRALRERQQRAPERHVDDTQSSDRAGQPRRGVPVRRRRAQGRAHLGAENHGVKPLDFPLLSDEHIAPDVVDGLRARGCDLRTAWEERLIGRPDVDVLERATHQGRVVVTHDIDSSDGPVAPVRQRMCQASQPPPRSTMSVRTIDRSALAFATRLLSARQEGKGLLLRQSRFGNQGFDMCCGTPRLMHMEVRVTHPDLELKLSDLAPRSGADELVQDALAAYFDEIGTLRSTLEARYDDLKNGRAQPIHGEEAFARPKAKKRRAPQRTGEAASRYILTRSPISTTSVSSSRLTTSPAPTASSTCVETWLP
jgi:hypothetical protein